MSEDLLRWLWDVSGGLIVGAGLYVLTVWLFARATAARARRRRGWR